MEILGRLQITVWRSDFLPSGRNWKPVAICCLVHSKEDVESCFSPGPRGAQEPRGPQPVSHETSLRRQWVSGLRETPQVDLRAWNVRNGPRPLWRVSSACPLPGGQRRRAGAGGRAEGRHRCTGDVWRHCLSPWLSLRSLASC